MRVRITTEEIELLGAYIHELTGVYLDARKAYLFEYRLSPLLQELGLHDYQTLFYKVRNEGGALRDALISAITTDETSFFRDEGYFQCLADHMIPQIAVAKSRLGILRPEINIWCAACSRGQEPFSVAMLFDEKLDLGKYHIRILATDISKGALDYAKQARYTKYELSRGMNMKRLERYFVAEKKVWRVRDSLRDMVHFQSLNLLRDKPPGGPFDLILCRNVALYFDNDDRRDLFRGLLSYMTNESMLMVGSTETLFELKELTCYVKDRGQYYQKSKHAGVHTHER